MEHHIKILRLAAAKELPYRIDKNCEMDLDVFKELVDAGFVDALDSPSMGNLIAYMKPSITAAGRDRLAKLEQAQPIGIFKKAGRWLLGHAAAIIVPVISGLVLIIISRYL